MEVSHFWIMARGGYGSHIEDQSKDFCSSFTDFILPLGLTGLIDFGEVGDISYGLGGGGEIGAIGSQVGEDSRDGFVSESWDGKEIFSWEGVFGFLG